MVRCINRWYSFSRTPSISALCPPIPIWRGYHVNTLERYSGTSVMYNCSGKFPDWTVNSDDIGATRYVFADGGSGMRMTLCSDDGRWMPPLAKCLGVPCRGQRSCHIEPQSNGVFCVSDLGHEEIPPSSAAKVSLSLLIPFTLSWFSLNWS